MLSVVFITGAAAFIAFLLPQWYTATVNIVPPDNQNSGLGGLLGNVTSALEDIGLSKLSGGSGNTGYTYMVILTSRSFQDSLIDRFELAKEYDMSGLPRELIRDEFKRNFEINFTPEGNYTLTATSKSPQKSADIANAAVGVANNIAVRLQHEEASANRRYMEARLRATDSSLAAIGDSLNKFSRENMLFSPLDQAKALATSLAELKATAIKQQIQTDIARQTLGENDPETRRQRNIQEQLEVQIAKAENEPGFAGNFSMKDAMGVGVRYLKFYTEFEALSKVKGFLMPMLEQVRLDEVRQIQTMFVVDAAAPPNKKSRPKRSVIIAGAAVGSFVLAALFLIVRRWLRHINAAAR
ncbi:Wzz/FepE/Etk N-terminal domain-containing protein [Ignavibacteria bacterium]